MSSQALRHLSMFLAAAIIICRFFLYIRFAGTVLYIIIFYLILFIFLFSSVLLRGQSGVWTVGHKRFL